MVNEKEEQEELASGYTEVEDKLEAQARKLMVACSENTQDLKKLHSKEEMANIQGIPRLLLRGKPCRLVSGGERIHQALARKGAQPPVLPFASAEISSSVHTMVLSSIVFNTKGPTIAPM